VPTPTATPSPTATPTPTPTPTPVDTTAPVTTLPVTSQRAGSALFGSAIPVAVAFTGSDELGGSGVAHYELEKTLDGGTTWLPINNAMGVPAANLTVSTAGTIQFRARTVDVAGNVGTWAAGPVLSPRLVQNTSANPRITWHKTWTVQRKSAFSGGSVRYATSKGATATIAVTGSSFALVTTKASDRGYVRIYVDGALSKRISLKTASTKYRQVVWQTTFASAGKHTIRIYVEGTAHHPRVDLDAFALLQ
jgi:hypothetical protein